MTVAGRRAGITRADRTLVERLVGTYRENQPVVEGLLNQIKNAVHLSSSLMRSVHSTKGRMKDPEHLRDKLERKILEARALDRKFSITEKNLLYRVNDLAGFRILHLHTQQMAEIDTELRKIFVEYRLPLLEKPKARTWDDESRDFFRSINIQCVKSPRMYTSVHYVVESYSRTRATCEIQVRTLAEELWGEVDHTMNYPKESESHACREQIKVLARVTSSCSRLVDSIFRTAGKTMALPTAKRRK